MSNKTTEAIEARTTESSKPTTCPLCGKLASSAYKKGDTIMWIYKHTRLVPAKSGRGKISQTTYCESMFGDT